ncbi:hypothetical protein [Methylobacterium radiotolerans]|uniref:hypothetical protein n=1 Tax=Methylobacterium radiotolerans TaxID=31998 RepID=UPI0038D14EE0
MEFRCILLPGGHNAAIVPGRFRNKAEENVAVGRHDRPSSETVVDFMAHFAKRFGMAEAGQVLA